MKSKYALNFLELAGFSKFQTPESGYVTLFITISLTSFIKFFTLLGKLLVSVLTSGKQFYFYPVELELTFLLVKLFFSP